MKAIILAAGISKRLRPLTDNTPKSLLTIGNKTILQLTIDNLLANELDDIIIVTGYLNNMLETYVKSTYPNLKAEFIHNSLYAETNNIYSLWLTKEKVAGNSFILLDSDIVFDGNILALLLKSNHQNCLALKSGFQLGEEEIKAKLNGDGSIVELSKVVKISEAVGESVGIEKFDSDFSRKLFEILDRKMLEDGEVNQFYEVAFEEMISKGEHVFPVDVGKHFVMEIDTAEDYEKVKNMNW